MAQTFQKVRIDIAGTTALLMHNDTLADPLDPRSKAFKKISGKRAKTDTDYEEMARLEFLAGLYLGETGIVLPYPNVMKCLIEGARMSKSGPKVERGVTIAGGDFPLLYEGPEDPEELYLDKRFVSRMTVKVGMARTVRCRPIFSHWAVNVDAIIDPAVVSPEELGDIADNAGAFIGLMDYRKGGGFGRFNATVTLN